MMRILWKKVPYGDEQGAEIYRIYGDSASVRVPECVEGLKVVSLAAYCFARNARLEDENMHITEAKEQSELGKYTAERELGGDEVTRIYLPGTIEKIGSYCFYNCRKLERLSLGGRVYSIGSDAFLNCSNLHYIDTAVACDEKSGIRNILDQVKWDVQVFYSAFDKEKRTGIFYPDYAEVYDEIGPAHIFGIDIQGEGFRMRKSFKDERVDLVMYDSAFEKACVEENENTMLKIVMNRLIYPVQLSAQSRSQYGKYMKDHIETAIELLIEERELSSFEKLVQGEIFSNTEIQLAAKKAAIAEWTEGSAFLIKLGSNKKKVTDRYSFDDEW